MDREVACRVATTETKPFRNIRRKRNSLFNAGVQKDREENEQEEVTHAGAARGEKSLDGKD